MTRDNKIKQSEAYFSFEGGLLLNLKGNYVGQFTRLVTQTVLIFTRHRGSLENNFIPPSLGVPGIASFCSNVSIS